MTIAHLYIYPIKSLGGIAVSEAFVEEKGFRHDRRFLLVQPDGTFMTQRTNHHMALMDVAIQDETVRVWHRHRPDDVLTIPLTGPSDALAPAIPVSVWDSHDVPAVPISAEADRWFSAALAQPCRLVFMPDTTYRAVEPDYVPQEHLPPDRLPAVSFADGYPYLLIGQASLDDLNRRLAQPIDMLRFRPNIVVSGSLPYDEDAWSQFQLGGLPFYGVKPCARCVLTTVDPQTGQKGKEPLRTLTTYRQWKHKILFGQNVLVDRTTSGVVRVGQPVTVVRRVVPWLDPTPVPAA